MFFNLSVKALAVAAIFYRIHVPWTAAVAPLGVALIVALGAGIGLILAPLKFLYRDISRALPVITTFWLFLTPIIFVSPCQGIASVIIDKINPVTQTLKATRDLIFPGSGGTREGLIAASIIALTLLFAAFVFHRVAMPVVLDRANS